jgi:DNA-binding XRE family transcriptional regulator
MSTFSERIKELRLEKNLTQTQLGEIIGVKHFSIYSYEKGRACPEMRGLVALADYFDVSMDYLAGRTDKRETNR